MPFLIKLATHLLSVCANSASYERLFSTFGLILTKLHNHMSMETLTTIAELKLHLRDEHLWSGAKERLRRHFRKSQVPVPPPGSDQVLVSGTGTDTDRDVSAATTDGHAVRDISKPAVSTNPETAHLEASEDVREDDVEEPCTIELEGIVEGFIQMSDEDVDMDEIQFPSCLKIPLKKLFDFKCSEWVDSIQQFMEHGLQEELELYELLDFDAGGEEDKQMDLDAGAQAVLTA
ncbi:hypothetical protein AcV5_002936 [Taiwanofungus camphoratus]|nr:hypothetical protein AcV5_002936 [Antrodia cinnamomea]